MNEFRHIGERLPIHDATEKANGTVKYAADMKLPNMLHAKLILSEKANADITINVDKALKVDGVVKIYTSENTPSFEYSTFKWIEGIDAVYDERLLSERARFHGDKIAMVVAKTKEALNEACRLVEVTYDEKTPVLDFDTSIEDKIRVHEGRSNIISSGSFNCGNAAKKMEEAYVKVTTKATTPKISHAMMEPHVSTVAYDSVSSSLTVYSPIQVLFAVQDLVAKVCDLPISKVRVVKTVMGGSFGGKTQPITELLASFAANDLKANVQLAFNRSDVMLASRTRTESRSETTAGFTKEGKLISRIINMDFDAGAYATNVETVATAAGKKSFRLYNIEDQDYNFRTVYTNRVISGATRAYGSPQIHSNTEVNMNMACDALNLDQIDIRLLNLVEPFANDPTNSPNLGNVRVRETLLRAKELFDYDAKMKEVKEFNLKSDRYKRGIGVACASHGNGYFPAFPDFLSVDMTFNQEGDVLVNATVHEQGCGTIISLRQIVAETLDLPLEKVHLQDADSAITPYDSAGTQACRVTFVIGRAMQDTANLLKDKLFDEISSYFEVSKNDITFKDGIVTFADKSYKTSEVIDILRRKVWFDPFVKHTYKAKANPASTATNIVLLEVDTIGGVIEVLEVTSVHDIGQTINTLACDGQIHGGLQMGLGLALSEQFLYNKDGKCLSKNFSNYNVFNSTQMPEIKIDYIFEENEHSPYGAKSIGEVATIPITPAVVNAVANATSHYITDLPITPEKIMNALNNN